MLCFGLQGHHSTNSLDFLTDPEQEALADTHQFKSQRGLLMIFVAGGDEGKEQGEREEKQGGRNLNLNLIKREGDGITR